jgi:hypothetical protein
MKTLPDQLIALAEALAAHQGVTHWAISMRLTSRGDTFSKLMHGADVRGQTYTRLLAAFDCAWPADLAWPSDVPRPSSAPRRAKA